MNIPPEVSLLIGGVPIALALFGIVELLKWGQFLRSEREVRLAVIIVAAILGGAWAAVQLKPEIGRVVMTLFTALIGICGAVATYRVTIGRNRNE